MMMQPIVKMTMMVIDDYDDHDFDNDNEDED